MALMLTPSRRAQANLTEPTVSALEAMSAPLTLAADAFSLAFSSFLIFAAIPSTRSSSCSGRAFKRCASSVILARSAQASS